MERLQDIGQILALCAKMTNLKLEVACGFDRQFAAKWYENEYLTGHHIRYVMKPDKFIASIEDGKVYRAFNTPDAKAVELMESNPEYRDFFIDMGAVPNTIPELGDDPFAEAPEAEPEVTEPEVTEPEVTEPEVTEPEAEPEVTEPEAEPEVTEPEAEPEVTEPEAEPEAEPEVTEPEAEPEVTEPTEEEIAAAKRSAAAKKAAATRAANKAAEAAAEAENADISEFE